MTLLLVDHADLHYLAPIANSLSCNVPLRQQSLQQYFDGRK